MTPAARYAAAIDVLDRILDGAPAEKALTNWARASRFAGSKDRAAVRNHVFDVLRKKRSLARLGGSETGRGLILGLLRDQGADPGEVFSGQGYAPAPLGNAEVESLAADPDLSDAERADLPDEIWDLWQSALGSAAMEAAQAARSRGPVTLRVTTRNATRDEVIERLSAEGVAAELHPDCSTALIVTENARRLSMTEAFKAGMFELQDASSQMAMAKLALPQGVRVLDYCAGGGGKSLALADFFGAQVVAHDRDTQRMVDLGVRAQRAGVTIEIAQTSDLVGFAPFEVVLVDAPCSGSGTWRRTPDMKWRVDHRKIIQNSLLQGEILAKASGHVANSGVLIYATCSVFREENQSVLEGFMQKNPTWKKDFEDFWEPNWAQDGFYIAQLSREDAI